MVIPQKLWILFTITLALIQSYEARRIRVRPLPQQEEGESVQYYAAEPRDSEDARVLYVSAADQYNGLYGQSTVSPRTHSQENYIPQSRGSASSTKSLRTKESVKAPPVQTIRNYNKVNDDGSFTFGYEAADGSFKEETRGTDCVVRGKYGYIDPDGNKREFTYVSGNPCDPNAPKEEEELPEEETNEPENIPANYPVRPIRPVRPITPAPKPTVTLFHSNYNQQEEEEPEPEQLLKPHILQSLRPQYTARPTIYQQQLTNTEEEIPSFQRSRVVPSTTPSSVVYKQSVTPINITPRPLASATARSELPATTYRPQLLHVAVTPRPALQFTKDLSVTPRPSILSSTPSSIPISVTRGGIDFESEFQRFQHDNSISPSPSPLSLTRTTPQVTRPTSTVPTPSGSAPVYSSELVFDPVSGLYNTQLYQTLPQTEGQFSLNHRIQPYVHQPQTQLLNIQQLQQQSPLYRVLRPQPTQTLYQQQQQDLQFQNSAQLFAQQQQHRARAQQAQHTHQVQHPQQNRVQQKPSSVEPQQFYYIQPSSYQHPQALIGGSPIDAFLRGQNFQF
ncbi:hypothetical protein RN001_004584 [Aquatica leii]|uniref:Uncharacterized protein n=1 Tax=Aquatica leii TaxID=1421715 RepID=A0AAN7SRS3_9COLE|nr:hypothetical protein RN001_004584 [Aquatica leii]